MISVEEYRETILATVRPLASAINPLSHALGLVSAEPVIAQIPLPPFTTSAMDGFAVRSSDVADASATNPATLRVVDDVPAGGAPTVDLLPGTCARIMTGAPVPETADAVVRVEDTNVPAGATPLRAEIEVFVPASVGANIRKMGEATQPGEVILPAGTKLDALAIAAIASVGVGELATYPRPKVAVLATGAELVQPGKQLGPGQIPDSNSFLLSGLLSQWGADVQYVEVVPDEVNQFGEVLEKVCADCDLVVTSGGVSAGAFDIVHDYGDVHGFQFPKVAMQPGKPQGFGRVGNALVLTLPGNPVSVWVSYLLFVIPVLRRLSGLPDAQWQVASGQATHGWKSPKGRRQFVPVVVGGDAGHPTVTAAHRLGSGSHLMSSAHLATALCVIPETVDSVTNGQHVSFLRLLELN